MAKVIATQRGYFGGVLREPNDTFVVPDGAAASWFRPVRAGAVEAAAPAEPDATVGPDAPAQRGRKKPETVMAPTAAPFADPPAPVRVENEINAATGGTQPDWIAQGADI